MAIKAPTVDNTVIVAVTASASAEQVLAIGKHRAIVSCTQAFYILFGQAGSVPTPTAANAFLCGANTVYEIETSNGANAFKVLRLSADGSLSWIKD